MNGKRVTIVLPLLFFTAFAFSEVSIEAGSGVTCVAGDLPDIYPDIKLMLGMEYVVPISKEWSFTFNAGGAGFFKPMDLYSKYFYSAYTTLSVRQDILFLKAVLSADGEQRYFNEIPGPPDLFDNRFEIEISVDIGDVTLSFLPSITWQKKDLGSELLSVEGSLGLSFLLFDIFVCKTNLEASAGVVTFGDTNYSLTPSFSFSCYPGLPFIVTETVGMSFQSSDYSEIILTDTIKRNTYTSVFLNSEWAIAFNDMFLLNISIPVKLKLFGYHAIVNSAFISDNEWVVYAGSELSLNIVPDESTKWVFVLEAERPFSNSDYLEEGSISFSISWQLNF